MANVVSPAFGFVASTLSEFGRLFVYKEKELSKFVETTKH